MKIILYTLLIFLVINLYADKNWIPIEPVSNTKSKKSNTKLDVNLSQIEPINKMMKNITVVKQLINVISEKEKPIKNDKNWFIMNTEGNK